MRALKILVVALGVAIFGAIAWMQSTTVKNSAYWIMAAALGLYFCYAAYQKLSEAEGRIRPDSGPKFGL